MKKNKLDNVLDKKSLQDLYQTIATLDNASEAEQFLLDLCTPAELMAMADRWQVVSQILSGKPYRQIHEETGVSITTIGRVARCISYGSGGYKKLQQRINNNEC